MQQIAGYSRKVNAFEFKMARHNKGRSLASATKSAAARSAAAGGRVPVCPVAGIAAGVEPDPGQLLAQLLALLLKLLKKRLSST